MRTAAFVLVCFALAWPLAAQEDKKPVPKDSVRVFIPGCSKGAVFTAGPRTEEQAGRAGIPEGTRLRMHGPKAMMAEIKAHEGSMIEISGLVRKGQYLEDGVKVAPGVRIGPGQSSAAGGLSPTPSMNQVVIDLEGWHPVLGDCPSR